MVQESFEYTGQETTYSSVYQIKPEEDNSSSIMNYAIRPANAYELEDGSMDPKQYAEGYAQDFGANRPHLHHMPSISTTSSFDSIASADSSEYPVYDLSTGGSQEYDWTTQHFQWPPNRMVFLRRS
jgi:hypothetical protein